MEPMTLGSPNSSPTQNSNPYMSSFLLGDASNASAQRNTTLSPIGFPRAPFVYGNSPMHGNDLFRDASSLHAASSTGMHSSFSNQQNNSMAGGQKTLPSTPTHMPTHANGPPITSLFDTLRVQSIPTSTPTHESVMLQQQQLQRQPHQRSSPQDTLRQQQDILAFSRNASRGISTPLRALNSANLSPPSMNQSYHMMQQQYKQHQLNQTPTYGMGSRQHYPVLDSSSPSATRFGQQNRLINFPQDKQRQYEFWITVFGYPPGATTRILQHFTNCGTILDKVQAQNNGNWMHIKYGSQSECEMALNYNHKIICGSIMIGVTRCTDDEIIDKENENENVSCSDVSPPHIVGKQTLRPLNKQALNTTSENVAINDSAKMPQKNNGFVNRALEAIFNW